jgi:FkbM family methyltransferase
MRPLLKRLNNRLKRALMNASERKRQVRYQQYEISGWQVAQQSDECEMLQKEGKRIKLRVNSTDFDVFKQVLVNQDYKVATDYFTDNGLTCSTIIDAGANVGFTTLYLKTAFPDASVVCIEPDQHNFSVLTTNIDLNKLSNVARLSQAVHHTGGLSMTISSAFRGGGEWARQAILSQADTNLKSITIHQILDSNCWAFVDLLKIDIEGAEQLLFESRETASFLDRTRVLVIEIHDEYDIRTHIYHILRTYGFAIFNFGETTFAFNLNGNHERTSSD